MNQEIDGNKQEIIEQELRQRLEQLLRRPVADYQWNAMLSEQWVESVLIYEATGGHGADDETEDINWLARKYRLHWPSMMLTFNPKPKLLDKNGEVTGSGGEEVELKERVLSLLLCYKAANEKLVVTFRKKHLNNKALQFEDVENWIRKQARQEKKQGKHLIFDPVAPPDLPPGNQRKVRMLRYAVPNEDYPHAELTYADGVLEELRKISRLLSEKYRWHEAAAAVFVLTNLAPAVEHITCKVEYRSISAASRIILTIDPAQTPKQVADSYRMFRNQLVKKHPRAISEKHLNLALYFRTDEVEETWALRMDRWNQLCDGKHLNPEWKYDNSAIFKRDFNQAQKRLLNPEYSQS